MKPFLLLLCISCLASCTSLRYGNFTQLPPHGVERMARDTALELSHVYPPAKNRLCLSQSIADPFGLQLIEGLRQKGFAVMEKTTSSREANFSYVVDAPIASHLYRVSVFVGERSLSRAYRLYHGELVPVSGWTVQESL
ncbi:conjugal transfer protein TrbH [Legionella birminghamensis]|uniref:Conjugal transfer protein TrbH n=1 Tax=Legionella birminghamensis TaxID=28083 RepID=A0A378JV17_9GAMM|nr:MULTISPECIES: hypothetical protein [Legionella]KTC71805.1 conjugal transfer protein TrbH [Legionella birminghamensis]MCW8452555.1 conjugal transfer protein TrbH [Legionella quinlivanii]STX60839.1 conjugal transfer protein TrbH [Legionella birminghamensis]